MRRPAARRGELWLLLARTLLAAHPLVAGVHRLLYRAGAAAFLRDAVGIPAGSVALVWLSSAIELAGAAAVLCGWRARGAACVLAAYYAAVAFGVHLPILHGAETTAVRDRAAFQVLEHLAIAGGFLALAAAGPGARSLGKS